MIGFSIRNIKVFFRNRTAVFFSLLAVFITIGLYALFLDDVWASSLKEVEGAKYLMSSWITAGLLAIVSVTTTMGAFGTLVEDRDKKIVKDFVSSPIRNSDIVGGYIISSFAIGVIMSLASVVLGQLYILSCGGRFMGAGTLVKVFGLILLSTFASSSMVLFLVSFFKSMTAFGTASSVLGSLIGFVTGIYLPIGQLPEAMQWIVKLCPISHAAALFRQVMMADAMSSSFAGASSEYLERFREEMGITLSFGQTVVSPLLGIIILAAAGAVFYGLSVLRFSAKDR